MKLVKLQTISIAPNNCGKPVVSQFRISLYVTSPIRYLLHD